jgi:hypothetical protein
LVLKRPRPRTDEDVQLITLRQTPHREVAVAIELAQNLWGMVRERQAARFEHGLALAVASGVVPRRRVALGRRADDEAVKAGLMAPWSTGPVDGHLNRLKMLKRSMCGRAKLDLLSQRFLLAACALYRSGGARSRPLGPVWSSPATESCGLGANADGAPAVW